MTTKMWRKEWQKADNERRIWKQGNDRFFFLDFGFKLLHAQGMESTPIYKGWKRDISSLFMKNLGS